MNLLKGKSLIKQLFDYSRLEAKGMAPNMEPFQISHLVDNTYSNYEIIAQKKEITLQVEMGQKLPAVFADKSLIERVMQNLMDNAIKFTPSKGSIKISLLEVKNKIQIKIHNTGKAIPADQLSSIFNRYQKIDKTFVKGNKLLLMDHTSAGKLIGNRTLVLHNKYYSVLVL